MADPETQALTPDHAAGIAPRAQKGQCHECSYYTDCPRMNGADRCNYRHADGSVNAGHDARQHIVVNQHEYQEEKRMNQSTEGVTLYAGFLSDLLANYQQEQNAAYIQPLFAMVKGLDLSKPMALVPMHVYNAMCQWIEDHLGPTNLRKAGEFIGARAYDLMLQGKYITSQASPQEILTGLQKVASESIQDPLKRGWEILVLEEKRAVLRRTQTFHPILQEGLLKALVKRGGKTTVTVSYLKSVARGDEFDEYEIRWYR